MNLYVYVIFESDGGRPRCAGILVGNKVSVYDLYRPGARKPVAIIDDNKTLIRDLIVRASSKGIKVVTSDFKNILRAFDLPIDHRDYNVYDLHLPDVKPTDSLATDSELITTVLRRMVTRQVKDYQKVHANAAVVYQDLENRGLWNNYVTEKTIWSQKVFSGRSKTTGFNIQNFTDHNYVVQPGAGVNDVLIHFDWISADIRVASILSGDQQLIKTFADSDPYTYMMQVINSQSEGQITRDECKTFLLSSINSMDFTNTAMINIYPQLGEWICQCKRTISEPGGYLETVLKRRFKIAHSKNVLAVLNGVQQGSVAHAMQHTIRRVWGRLGRRLIMEGHDSLVVSSANDPAEVKSVIKCVAQIMLYPFDGLLPDNPAFPLKVSIGKKWRQWKLAAIYRDHSMENKLCPT